MPTVLRGVTKSLSRAGARDFAANRHQPIAHNSRYVRRFWRYKNQKNPPSRRALAKKTITVMSTWVTKPSSPVRTAALRAAIARFAHRKRPHVQTTEHNRLATALLDAAAC